MAERRLEALTSARFFACLLVVLYHQPGLTTGWPGLESVARSGYLGVTFFFALSGFVLAAVYGRRPKVAPRKFYVARFARIYPVYLLSILIVAGPYFTGRLATDFPGASPPLKLAEILSLRTTMLSAWFPGFALRLNGPAWSLSVEAFFYAVFPFTIGWMLRSPMLVRRVVIAAILVANFGVGYLLAQGGDNPVYGWYRYLPLAHLGTFLIGCEAGLAYLDREKPRRGDGPWALVCGTAVVAVFLLSGTVSYALLHNGLLALPFAALILWLARNDARLGWMAAPPLVLLGEASYGIYILQSPFGIGMERIAPLLHLPGPSENVLGFALYLAVLILASIVSFRYFETPARAWLRAKLEPPGSKEGREAREGLER